jgi:hypothetical protein
MRRIVRNLCGWLLLLPAALLIPACNETPFTPQLSAARHLPTGDRPGKIIVGPAVKVGRGHARGFIVLGSDLRPASVGVFMTRGALYDLPSAATEWHIALPIGRNVAPFDHIGLNWNPQGHPPPGVYDVPHFDFHFYRISIPEQHAIAGGPETNPPASNRIPLGYVTTGETDPEMGVHYIDPSSPEFQPGGTFTRTMIYGFFDGEMIFLEPMATTAFLLTHPNVSLGIPQPSVYPETGRYPLTYSVRYDTQRNGYIVSLDNLTPRTAP